MQLSPHFSLEEFIASATAARLGIDNTPSPEILERLKITAAGLEKVRVLIGKPLAITSGYRSVALNAHVPGSSNTSAHTLGWAADFHVACLTPFDLCNAVAASSIVFDQVIHEYRAWCHLSFDPRHRGLLTTKFAGQPYRVGLIP